VPEGKPTEALGQAESATSRDCSSDGEGTPRNRTADLELEITRELDVLAGPREPTSSNRM
jgi:hypothetical protein